MIELQALVRQVLADAKAQNVLFEWWGQMEASRTVNVVSDSGHPGEGRT